MYIWIYTQTHTHADTHTLPQLIVHWVLLIKTSYSLPKEPSFYQKSPTFYQKSPTFYHKSPIFYKKSPIFYKKSPTFYQKSPTFNQKSHTSNINSPTFYKRSHRALTHAVTPTHTLTYKHPPHNLLGGVFSTALQHCEDQ